MLFKDANKYANTQKVCACNVHAQGGTACTELNTRESLTPVPEVGMPVQFLEILLNFTPNKLYTAP